jgi:hypothetical protein
LICFFGTEIFNEINSLVEVSTGVAENRRIDLSLIIPDTAVENTDATKKETSIVESNKNHSKKDQESDSKGQPSPYRALLLGSPIEEYIERSPISFSPHLSGTPDNITWESHPPIAARFEDLLNIGTLESKIYIAYHRKIPEILSI